MGEKIKEGKNELIYSLEDVPPWYTSIFLGLQHYLTMLGATVSLPFLICPALCIEETDAARGYIMSTLLFVSGIVTVLQSTIGIRLPIVQGGTFSFITPTFAILALKQYRCPEDFAQNGWGNMTAEDKTEEWQVRMRAIQGSICVASVLQVVMGYCGIIGIMLKYITPLTIAPSVAMIGISLFGSANSLCAGNWGISMGTVLVMVLFSQYLKDVPLPVPSFVWSEKKLVVKKTYILRIFPVLLTMVFMWMVCLICTLTDVLPEGDPGRVDSNLELIDNVDWVRIPYPFQWGWPTVTVAGVFGMMAGVLASAIESIGDYYACARLAGAPPPPTHAINRGIGTEGLGCIIAGMIGSGNGTTSYSENIGAIGVTKVGSRRVVQYGGLIMIFFGLISKFGAVFLTIPQPIVGGFYCVLFGLIAAVGLSNLQFVDLNSSRNLFILGFSMFIALVVPQWLEENGEAINTGSDVLDQIIKVMLTTSMFIAGFSGFILDNTIPGTAEERGLVAWNALSNPEGLGTLDTSCYDIPMITKYLNQTNWAKYVPCLPAFKGFFHQELPS